MGTNFYFITQDKELTQSIAPYSYTLTDTPCWGYEIHIAKTSCGWLPLFQAHNGGISSVEEIRQIYQTGKVKIFDEYSTEYNWDEFDERVLKFNGGKNGVQPKQRINKGVYVGRDKDMPDYIPISHFEYGNGKYSHMYHTDKEGYEFTYSDFS